jgi:copper chaperone
VEEVVIGISGMTCSGCVQSVKRVLSSSPGIEAVDVSLEKNQALVNFDPQTIDTAQIKRSIEDAGFEIR